ncbi:MAG: phosphatase PAP2 family protein [Armatimonadota bacterium]
MLDTAQPPRRSPRTYALWLSLAILLACAFVLDNAALALVKPFHNSHAADAVNATIRMVGTGYVQIPVALLMVLTGYLASVRLRRAGLWTLVAFLVSGVSVNILKVIVSRARPWTTEPPPVSLSERISNSNYQSFPSAETTTTFAVFLTIAAWYPSLRVPLLVVAILIGLARVFVGSHHPSDVVAGAMLGIATAQFLARSARRREQSSDGR